MFDLRQFIEEHWEAEERCCIWENDWIFKWKDEEGKENELPVEQSMDQD